MEAALKPALELAGPPFAPHGNIGARWHVQPHFLFSGKKHQGHTHATDHLTFLESGTARVFWKDSDGNEGKMEFTGPMFCDIQAERWHLIEAVTDIKWFCIFAAPSDKLMSTPYYAQIPPDVLARRS